MKEYKVLFLDWDDTIGDWAGAEQKALQDIYVNYHLDILYPAFEDYLNAYKPYNLELWTLYGQGKVTKEWLHEGETDETATYIVPKLKDVLTILDL